MADIFSDVFGMFGGANEALGGNLAGVLVMLQLPMIFIFTLVSAVLFYQLFGNKLHFVFPWQWTFHVTTVRPYANKRVSVFQDKGAVVNVGGFTRFKLKLAKKLMQKPDTTDIYSNNEIVIVTMGPDKRFNGQRTIDYKNHKVIFDVENPQVAQQFYTDMVQETDPEFMLRKINSLYLIWLIWFFSGLIVVCSNFLIIYPIFVKVLFRG